MTVLTADSLLHDLERFKLLTPEQQIHAERAVRHEDLPPARLLQFLQANGSLTKFQVDALTSGHGAKLVFGPYILLDRIGDGGMGVVYKARHTRLERIDALKVIRSDKIASKVVARRFLREIRLTSSLQHPHIVRAHDAGTIGSHLYLATEFVNGRNLAKTVKQHGPLSIAETCLVAYQTALALQHIHEHKLVHRDVKPSNLLRDDATGAVKLLDLGLSGVNRCEMEPEQSVGGALTHDGVLLGTPDYMAPEQAQNPSAVDIRADLYGLGCTMFYLVTGRPPFEGNAVEKLFKHSYAAPPPAMHPTGTTPSQFIALVAKLMAKKPDDRFPDPAAVVHALLALRPGSQAIPHPAARPGSQAIAYPAPRPGSQVVPRPAPRPGSQVVPRPASRSQTVPQPAPRVVIEPTPAPKRVRWWMVGVVGVVFASLVMLGAALASLK